MMRPVTTTLTTSSLISLITALHLFATQITIRRLAPAQMVRKSAIITPPVSAQALATKQYEPPLAADAVGGGAPTNTDLATSLKPIGHS